MTLVERKSRFLRIGRLVKKSAKETQRAIQRRSRPMAERVQTLTFENGKEFLNHMGVRKTLEAAVFSRARMVPGSAGPTKIPMD